MNFQTETWQVQILISRQGIVKERRCFETGLLQREKYLYEVSRVQWGGDLSRQRGQWSYIGKELNFSQDTEKHFIHKGGRFYESRSSLLSTAKTNKTTLMPTVSVCSDYVLTFRLNSDKCVSIWDTACVSICLWIDYTYSNSIVHNKNRTSLC